MHDLRDFITLFACSVLLAVVVACGVTWFVFSFPVATPPLSLDDRKPHVESLTPTATGTVEATSTPPAQTPIGEAEKESVPVNTPATTLPPKITIPKTEPKTEPKPEPQVDPVPRTITEAEDFSSSEVKRLLTLHNKERAKVGVDPLTWSDTLAASADRWATALAARDCALEHSGTDYGENIYYSRKYGDNQTPRTPEEVMKAFIDEKPFYNIKTNTCKAGEICGHYTQIVWDTTEEMGCSRHVCLDNERKEIWVCHYDPPGNVEGLRPY